MKPSDREDSAWDGSKDRLVVSGWPPVGGWQLWSIDGRISRPCTTWSALLTGTMPSRVYSRQL